jgi:hypothetical protein
VAWVGFACGQLSREPGAGQQGDFPGLPWPDTDGVPINAHGFCIVPHAGKFYWYGSHKIAGKTESEKNEAGVRCYVSSDLLNWTNAGLVLDLTCLRKTGPLRIRGKSGWLVFEKGSEHERQAV